MEKNKKKFERYQIFNEIFLNKTGRSLNFQAFYHYVIDISILWPT